MATTGCSKSVDFYTDDSQAREKVLMHCLIDKSDFKSGDCAHAKEAQVKIDDAHAERARMDLEQRAKQAALDRAAEAKVAAEKKAVRDAAIAEATAKFKAVETQEKQAFDLREAKIAAVTPQVAAETLVAMANAINRGDLNGAAAAVHAPIQQLGGLLQAAQLHQGIASVEVKSFNASQGVFQFRLKGDGYGSDVVPTGYDMKAENGRVVVAFPLLFRSKPTCYTGNNSKLTLYVDRETGALAGQLEAGIPPANAGWC
jgi:hypothetical protein